MTTKNVQIRMENELKKKSDELFNNFAITLDKPNTKTKKAIEEAYAIQDGKIEAQVYDTVDNFMNDLRS